MKIKTLFLSLLFFGLITHVALADPVPRTRGNEGFVVVLDAGHGGHDPGNLGNGYMEKNIALNIVLQVGELLQRTPGVKVVYTRNDDTFVDLFKRGEIANKANADLFVSVHCDAHSSNAYGATTYVLGLHANKQNFEVAKKENSVIYLEDNYEARYAAYDINSPESVIGMTIMQEEFLDQSILLGKLIQDNFVKKLTRNDRKVRQAGFIVLHQTFMPSVLVETGYLTNKEEGRYLNSAKGQSEMGMAIADAILNYRNSIPDDASVISNGGGKTVVRDAKPEIKKPETVAKDTETATENAVKKEVVQTIKEAEKTEPPKTEEKTDTPKQRMLVSKGGIIFKVQLMASSKDLPLTSAEFKGLNKISKEPVNKMFRYLYGNTDTYMGAKLLKANADQKGFTTSYIVAYKEGKRIPLEEALKYEED